MATRWGCPPSTWLALDEVYTAFDYEVYTKAKLKES